MAQQLLCDNPSCPTETRVISTAEDRMDAFLTAAQRPAEPSAQRDFMNFHWPCWAAMPPMLPAPGVSITLRRYTPPPAVPAES
ncbi:hypothetical protein ACFV0D_12575 [Streptomyces sp. NPDC059556]|uniref:hypothetical protein n=1 Tax=Streptomyces sp. NPDC059556 TaxID=3346863 RepID=UPI0036B6CB25